VRPPAISARGSPKTPSTRSATTNRWVRHVVDQIAHVGENQLFCRFTTETVAPDGALLALPCVTVIRLVGERVVDYRVHMDISPALAS
jgi:hypothetical protein